MLARVMQTLFAASSLAGCGDAILGALVVPAPVTTPVPLSARNLALSNNCRPEARWIHIEGEVGAPGAPELHVVGVEQGGSINVHISRKEPLIIALTSSSEAHWVVTTSSGTALQKILVVGERSSIQAPAGVDVQQWPLTLGCGVRYPPLREDPCNTYALLATLERVTARPLNSFVGCEAGTRFEVVEPVPPRWDAASLPDEFRPSPDGLALRSTLMDFSVSVARASTPLWAGRWYFEQYIESAPENGSSLVGVGLASDAAVGDSHGSGWMIIYGWDGRLFRFPFFSAQMSYVGPPLAPGDRVGVAVDLDDGKLWVSVNDTWLPGDPASIEGISFGLYPGVLPLYPAISARAGFGVRADWLASPPPGFRSLLELGASP